MLCNETFLVNVQMFNLHPDLRHVSDHIPISATFDLELDISLMQTNQSIKDIFSEANNHSSMPVIRMNSIKKSSFQNIFRHLIINFKLDEENVENSLRGLRRAFYVAAKGSKLPKPVQMNQQQRTTSPLVEDIKNLQQNRT